MNRPDSEQHGYLCLCWLELSPPSPLLSSPLDEVYEKNKPCVFYLGSVDSFCSLHRQVALKNKVTLGDCLNYVKEARAKGLTAPVVLMGYLNPFLAYGLDDLMKDASEAGEINSRTACRRRERRGDRCPCIGFAGHDMT